MFEDGFVENSFDKIVFVGCYGRRGSLCKFVVFKY